MKTFMYMRLLTQYTRTALVLLAVFTVLLGGIYPLTVYGLAQLAFNEKANGSLIHKSEAVIGSQLIGQEFGAPRYFWGRLSAATPYYNASASSGSNLSPASPKLLKAANERIEALQKADPKNTAPIPVDLITASGSGLDPHISLTAAYYQVTRVAKARGKKPEVIAKLVDDNVEGGILSVEHVNVLRLNLLLDELPTK